MWTERLLSRLLAGTIIAALAFAPLAFGAVEPWAYSVLAVLAYTALALACVRAAVRRSASGFATPILLPAGLALLLVAVQYAEWPVGILKAVSPEAARFYAGAAALTGVEGEAAGFAPSLYRHATRDALIRLSSYVALFLATCAYVRTRKHISTIAGAIVTVGFAVSLIGIVQNLAGTRKLYGWRELTRGGALFGPFVSRNQFASYAGVCLFVGLGLLLAHAAHAAGSTRRWREGLQRVLTCRAHRDFLVAFAVGLIGAAVIWSLSRGGILSLVLSFAGVFLAARLTRFVGGKQLYVAAVCLVIVAWVTYLGWDSVVKRVSTLDEVARDPLATWRWRIYSDAGRMSLRFPLLGTGAGTFLSVYPFYRTLPTDAITVSPHNEYLHVLVETGFGGLAILLLTMGLIYRRVWRGLSDRHYPFARGFLAGGVGALLMVTLHSLVDFPMRSPAIAATMAVTAALLYRATTIKGDRKSVPGALHADPGGNPVGEGADGDPPGETGGEAVRRLTENIPASVRPGGWVAASCV
ncbi:MAG: O-antigen ligase family protein [Candidatus Brocadiia bacterium]|nr:O-antigen ligase family protein [Candidatus Brocadiia bacterium]